MDFTESRWFKVINGWAGIISIVVSLIIFAALLIIYIARTRSRKESSNIFSFFTDDYRSTPTKILKVIIFLILAVGFMGVVFYNINRMSNGDPMISMKVDTNTFTPTILFCPPDSNNKIEVKSGTYIDADAKSEADLIESFNDIQINNITCKLFNETLFTNKPKESIGGSYNFTFISSINAIAVNIGDFSNNMNNMNMISMSPTHVDIHSDVGIKLVTGGMSKLQYIETRYVDLDGGKAHRGFQLNTIASVPTTVITAQTVMNIIIYAQDCVMVNSENPSLNLATFLGNLGGYLSICGIFGFLFGSGKVSPFGFVTDYCFPDQDRESLTKHLDNDNDNDNNPDKVNPETESKSLLTEYYIDMELFSK